MELMGGPGDGDTIQVAGQPLPGFVTYFRPSSQVAPMVEQHQFRPVLGLAYELDRAALRYVWRPERTTKA